MATVSHKPIPDRQDLDHSAFWNGTEKGELRVKQCTVCNRTQWPPRAGCPHCGATDVEWVTVPPKGELFSWTVVHRNMTPGFEEETPYAVILVQLTEVNGVRMIGNLVDCSLDKLRPGLPLEAVFAPDPDGTVTLVNWRPAPGGLG